MRKKVIDIYPPCNKSNRKESACVKKRNIEGCKKGWVLPLVFVIFAFCGYFYYSSYRTEIVVTPITEKFLIEDKEASIRSFGALEDGELRGVVLSEKVSASREFPIEGREVIEEKTEGTIEVCQSYRDSDAPFREQTRFISEEGKLFFAKDAFVLPRRQTNNGCAVVEIIAAEPGEEYNLSTESKFALPGLDGTDIYGKVQGSSFKITKKGFFKEVPFLDDQTKQRAEEKMIEDILVKGKSVLEENYGGEYVINNDEQYFVEIIKRDFLEDERDVEKFHFTLDASVKIITMKKEDIDSFISISLPENHTWREETKKIDINFLLVNFEDGNADIKINFSGDIYEEIEKEEWRRNLVGLDFEDARNKIENETRARNIDIRTRPFGINRVASSPERVVVLLNFDSNE